MSMSETELTSTLTECITKLSSMLSGQEAYTNQLQCRQEAMQ